MSALLGEAAACVRVSAGLFAKGCLGGMLVNLEVEGAERVVVGKEKVQNFLMV